MYLVVKSWWGCHQEDLVPAKNISIGLGRASGEIADTKSANADTEVGGVSAISRLQVGNVGI